MKIALVGGAGFIGHNLALSLKASRNHRVACFDSLMVNNLLTIQKDNHVPFLEERLSLLQHADIPLLRTDARDYDVMSRSLAHFNPDVIVHLAAIAHITVANKSPYTTFDNSLRTLENSLDIARALDCGLMYFSSSTVYGDFSQPTVDEDEPQTPHGIYGNLKMAGERMVIAYNQTYGMPATIIRPQALYGPRCVSGRVTQIFAENAFMGKPIEIHGDGTEKHDFTYIADLVRGLTYALTRQGWEPGMMETYNLTGECATSLSDLAKIVTKRYPTEVRFGPKDPDKPSRGTMSCNRIWEKLGYTPEYDIEKGMNEYMDWYERAWGHLKQRRA
jgi:nucleoside-diphosphate-sugar epimerase